MKIPHAAIEHAVVNGEDRHRWIITDADDNPIAHGGWHDDAFAARHALDLFLKAMHWQRTR